MMATIELKARVVQEPAAETRRRLETFVARMERRYECPTSVMIEAVAAGRMKETAEVSRWLISFRTLRHLQAHGSETGTSTSSTR